MHGWFFLNLAFGMTFSTYVTATWIIHYHSMLLSSLFSSLGNNSHMVTGQANIIGHR